MKTYTEVFESRDYLKVMREFTRRINTGLDALSLDRVYRGSPDFEDAPLTHEDCVPNGMSADLKGKVIVMKTGVLAPEYRALSHQLHLATGGFGCSPGASGRAVFCTNLYSGEACRFERPDILGVAEEDSGLFPQWERDKLTRLRKQPEQAAPQFESVLEKIKVGKNQREQDNPAEQARQPPRKQRKRKDESER